MPAYQVTVATYWQPEWAVRWQAYEEVGSDWGATCFYRETAPIGQPWRHCDGDGDGYEDGDYYQLAEPVYAWVEHFDGWHTINLRAYSAGGSWYYEQRAVRTTGSGGELCEYEFSDPNPGDSVRIPVIEIQSVLRDPCVLDGSCP